MAWTIEHFYTLPITIIVLLIFAIWLGKKMEHLDEKYRLIPIHIISFILVALEILKQFKSYDNGYDLYHLPLHFCGMFVFLFPAFSLCQGKSKYVARLLTTLSGIMLTGFMIIMPDIVYGDDDIRDFFVNFWAFHTVFFHNLVLLGTFLIFTLKLFKPRYHGDYKIVLLSYTIYCALIAPVSLILDTNFNNFCRCSMPFIEEWRLVWIDTLGYFGQLLYTSCAMIGTIGFGILMYFVYTKLIVLYNYILRKHSKYEIIG